MAAKEKGHPEGAPIPNCVVYHDATESKASPLNLQEASPLNLQVARLVRVYAVSYAMAATIARLAFAGAAAMTKAPRKRTPKQKYALYWRIWADTTLSLPAKAVATALLLKFHNVKTGRCDPGAGSIAKAIGISRRTVFNAIAELKDAGWIAVKSIQGGGPNCTNRYSFDFKRMKSASPPDSAQDAPSTSAQDLLVHETTHDSAQFALEPLKNHSPFQGEVCVGASNDARPPQRVPDGTLGMFEELCQFWDSHKPDGVDKKLAWKAFEPLADHGEEILASAARWVAATEPRWLKKLELWLGNGAWKKNPPQRQTPTRGGKGKANLTAIALNYGSVK